MVNFFNRISGSGTATLFEIRLENDIIVLRGGEDEASSQILKGTVVLCLPAALKVEDVHLRMTGQLRVAWLDQRVTPTGISNNKESHTTDIFNHRWPPFVGGTGPGSSSKGVLLPAGNYEWPFELVIPGGMAESVEGLADSHIVYKLKATVARGKLAYDLHAWKPIRIVRTLDPSALELAHAMTVENVWPNKIEYQLIIPQKAIVFGTAIDVEMRFTSLLKGLRIGPIKCNLVESQEFVIPGPTTAYPDKQFKTQRDVDNWSFEMNEEEHYHDMLNENGQDGYSIHETLPLPKRLQKCMQDVDVHGIKIRHKVKFNIALYNPDGHVSELRATLPVTIFISPNVPLNSEGVLVDQTPTTTQRSDLSHHAPPLYGEHVLDQLYADMDQSGLMTPAPQSGMNTPFGTLSRAGSHENLAAMASPSHPAGAVPPAALSSRLQDLHSNPRNSGVRRLQEGASSGSNTPHPPLDSEAGYFDQQARSGQSSNAISRRASEDGAPEHISNAASGQHTPEHVDYSDLGDLRRVPSYGTAIKTPVRGLSYTDVAPNYDTAISAPPSPEQRFSAPTTPGVGTSPSGNSSRLNPFSSMGFTPIHPPAPAHNGDVDERRRLHILRNRERLH